MLAADRCLMLACCLLLAEDHRPLSSIKQQAESNKQATGNMHQAERIKELGSAPWQEIKKFGFQAHNVLRNSFLSFEEGMIEMATPGDLWMCIFPGTVAFHSLFKTLHGISLFLDRVLCWSSWFLNHRSA